MTPECRCGSFVTALYVRVRGRPDYDGRGDVGACPNCNIRRQGNEFREYRSGSGYNVEVALND